MPQEQMTIDDLGAIIKQEFNHVKGQLKELKQGQENIELKLSNVAYCFELKELD